ncbi:MAG: SET domain-containing protein-lysine N-methyltransferase [Anaerolineales bacterium]
MYERAHSSYISPKLETRQVPQKGGYGVFALEPIAADEVVIVWGGKVMTLTQIHAEVPANRWRYVLQIDEDLYLVSDFTRPPEEADFINHSCSPNVGIRGQIALVAMRAIAPGEELCFDYAMTDGSPYDEFACLCETTHCRKHITGEDWRIPELQTRYAGYFSAYLQRRIDLLKKTS